MGTSTMTESHSRRVTGLERGLALGSLGCGLLLAAALVVFAVRDLGFLVLALAGLAVSIGGLWWAVTEQCPVGASESPGALSV